MPAGSLLALLDDIASVLDDVATMTQVATKKTAGVLGDDLALNAQQVTGVRADRELPVVWAVAKGSAKNKLILVPTALVLSAAAPWAVKPLLMVGGAFLCFEGFEKIVHKLQHEREHAPVAAPSEAGPALDPAEVEKGKIQGAIRTDFVLSAEIIVIALGTVATAPLDKRVLVLCAVAAIMTVGVYGLVAGIVKLDDLGLALRERSSAVARAIGDAILRAAPYMMKTLSVAGTVAMFLVGGSIAAHGIPGLEARVHAWQASAGAARALVPLVVDGVVGVLLGGVAVAVVSGARRVLSRPGSRDDAKAP